MAERATDKAVREPKQRVKLLSASEMQKAVEREIITIDEYKSYLREIGYSPKDIKIKLALIETTIEEKPPSSEPEEVRNLRSFEQDVIANAEAIRG